MKLLLDTHVFLWFISGDRRLPGGLLQQIRDPQNEVSLSVVSLWEVIIKSQIGKLHLPEPPETFLPKQRALHQITSLSVDEASVVELAKLPALHRDPFDRLLVCQAVRHGLTIATVDTAIMAYPVACLSLD